MLEGIRVVELGTAITGPLAAMMLADLGADVVKVEPPGGDQFRRGTGGSYAPTFVAYNRNKRSIVLDLAGEEGRAALAALLADADVLLDNFRPGVLARLGLEPETLRRAYPRLVHCSITGFGTVGPYRDRPSFDLVGQALSGLASLFIDPDAPQALGPTLSDNMTGMVACNGILAALVERGRTGQGRRIEVNMLEATMAFISDRFTHQAHSGRPADRLSRVASSQCFAFRCSDGGVVAVHLSTLERLWRALLDALDLPALADDPRFGSHVLRTANYQALSTVLGERLAERPRADWLDILAAHDVPAAPVLSVAEAAAQEQVAALGSIAVLDHPSGERMAAVRCPVLVDGARPRAVDLPAPLPGEHTEEILAAAGFGGRGTE